MDLEYQLVPYSDELRDAYLELLPEQELEVGRGKLEWKFRDAPGGTGVISVARDGEKVVGLNGFMAATFRIGTGQARGFQSMDTIVSPVARGRGVFGKLINCFYDESEGALLYGFPNLNSSPAFFGKLGWNFFGPVPMLVRPLRAGYFLKRIARFLPDFQLPLLCRRAAEAEAIARFDESSTAAWRSFSRQVGCAVERDADYLNWRFSDHPTERYTILRGADGAFVVSSVAAKHGARIGYVMEAIGSAGSLPGLIAESLHRMRSSRAEMAFAWCLPWSPNYAAYRRAGFLPFPARLRPIVINFGARPINASDPAVTDPKSWYISYSDSDTA